MDTAWKAVAQLSGGRKRMGQEERITNKKRRITVAPNLARLVGFSTSVGE